MKPTDTDDLSGKDKSILGIETHPVPFPKYTAVIIKQDNAVETVLEHLKDYQDREFYITPDNYGLMVSVNYVDGKFHSMILKGTGDAGERISDSIATMLVPKESKCKQKVTLHALLTIQDINRFSNGIDITEVPRVLKHALRNGFRPYDDKKIICRPFRLYVDGTRQEVVNTWAVIGNIVITAFSLEYNYDELKEHIGEEVIVNDNYRLPQRGVVIEDLHPDKDGAFPETHFLFDDTTVTIDQKGSE